MDTTCAYCPLPIDRDAPDWGYTITMDGRIERFHCECLDFELEPIEEDMWILEGI